VAGVPPRHAAWKCDGLTDEQLRQRSVPPSTLSLLGLVRHMAEEYARHNGHADLLRERIDGAKGDSAGAGPHRYGPAWLRPAQRHRAEQPPVSPAFAVKGCHLRGVVTAARHQVGRYSGLDPGQIRLGERQVERTERLTEPLLSLGADQRNDVGAAG
jgi:hypothetical protein